MNWSLIDFERLKRINPDAVGWIRLADTPIDYPIVQEHEDGYYLQHNFSGEISKHGAICLDSNPQMIFPDRQNRIRGHNMFDGSMFRALTNYLDHDFFVKHPCVDILTEELLYQAQIWAVISVPYSEEYLSIVPETEIAFEKWKSVIAKRSIHHPPFLPSFCDKNIVFCTCQTEDNDGFSHGDVLVFCVIR